MSFWNPPAASQLADRKARIQLASDKMKSDIANGNQIDTTGNNSNYIQVSDAEKEKINKEILSKASDEEVQQLEPATSTPMGEGVKADSGAAPVSNDSAKYAAAAQMATAVGGAGKSSGAGVGQSAISMGMSGGITGGMLAGAEAGGVTGPQGAAIGAAVGLTAGVVTGLMNASAAAKERKRQAAATYYSQMINIEQNKSARIQSAQQNMANAIGTTLLSNQKVSL